MKKIYYHYKDWEDYKEGMFKKGFTTKEEKELIRKAKELLCNKEKLYSAMKKTSNEWKHSAEINLSNQNCNRQAWLGAAACCISFGCPEQLTKKAWHKLNQKQKDEANSIADKVTFEFEKNLRGENIAQTRLRN